MLLPLWKVICKRWPTWLTWPTWPTWVISKCCCVCKKLFERGEDNASIIELNKNIDLISVVGQDELVRNGRQKNQLNHHMYQSCHILFKFLMSGCGRGCRGSLVGGEKKCYRGSKTRNRHAADLFLKPIPISTLTAIFVENPTFATSLLSRPWSLFFFARF